MHKRMMWPSTSSHHSCGRRWSPKTGRSPLWAEQSTVPWLTAGAHASEQGWDPLSAPILRTWEQLRPGKASPRVFFFITEYLQYASPNSTGRCCILRYAGGWVSWVHNCSQDWSKNPTPSPFLPQQESPDMSSNDVMCQNFLMTLSPLISV